MKKLTGMYDKMRSMVRDEQGATMVEYALMVAFIAAVAVTIVTTLGTKVVDVFTTVSGAI